MSESSPYVGGDTPWCSLLVTTFDQWQRTNPEGTWDDFCVYLEAFEYGE